MGTRRAPFLRIYRVDKFTRISYLDAIDSRFLVRRKRIYAVQRVMQGNGRVFLAVCRDFWPMCRDALASARSLIAALGRNGVPDTVPETGDQGSAREFDELS